MDTTRISIARVLALDVPLTWQDAVAVAQEAAMLSDVNAAMNSRPSLVSPEACFITRSGDLELPETTDVEAPEAVADLLREMLAGRDAPEALEALAYGQHTRDLSGDLSVFPIGNRRAAIARLATRALTVLTAPVATSTAAAPPQAPPATAVPATTSAAAPAAPVERAAAPIPFPAPVPRVPAVVPPPFVATPRPPVVEAPPFRATPPFVASAPAAARPPDLAAAPAPDAELRRLRYRTAERERRNRRWSARLAQWLTWRPSFPDPRLLGGGAVVIAAIVAMLWRESPDGAPAARDSAAAPSASSVATAAPPAAPAGTSEATAAHVATPPATGHGAMDTGAGASPRSPRAADSASVSAAAPFAGAAPAPAVDDRRASEGPTPSAAPAADAPTAEVPEISAAPSSPVPEPRRPAASGVGRGARGRAAPYSAGDADVAPPVMVRQQLPSALLEPDSAVPADWPYLELIIDEQGTVEQVRLRARAPAPGQTLYRHRMLLAAAKAWQFEPARLNGQPVRYVMRVPLEP